MKIPPANHSTAALIDKAHESLPNPPRFHLGASLLGHSCNRWLWLSFRLAVNEPFPGRILRLFRRGQNEEATVIDDLQLIGCDVTAEENGRQMRVDFGCHVSGSMDGVINSGLPESPKKSHVLEIKTHSLKSFADLQKKGVQKSKPQHFTQMQVYMAGTGHKRALYAAICKNDDNYHFERIHYDADHAMRAIARGHTIVKSDRMPEPPTHFGPDWFECKYCAAYELCYKDAPTKEVNCRTCAHYTAKEDSTDHCARWDATIPKENILTGCRAHVFHIDLVPWKFIGGDGINANFEINGKVITNGESGAASVDIIAKG